MYAIICIFDFMNFMPFLIKFIKFKPLIKFKKFELHNYDLYCNAPALLRYFVRLPRIELRQPTVNCECCLGLLPAEAILDPTHVCPLVARFHLSDLETPVVQKSRPVRQHPTYQVSVAEWLARLTAVREDPGSNHAADSCVYRDGCCDIQS